MAADATAPSIPHIHLLLMEQRFSEAFLGALAQHHHPASVSFEVHHSALQQLPAAVQFDLVVSPANSYGRLDGSFDDAISRAFSPRGDYLGLTRVAQTKLYDEWRGFAPPGTCTLVRIPEDFKERSKNVWGTKFLALCPTMRTPQEVTWDREVVYEAVWSLLCAVDKHNIKVRESKHPEEVEIRSLLMTPLATGCGRVSPEKWAHQLVLALKHFVDAKENPARWRSLEPGQIFDYTNEVVGTWTM
ncbi:hypothetical protein TOPH_02757 [Tolypocladium ophioglossoides CBS 100239]|uniref:Macro domain-like protein n=1 Tax=Tolypocladium ophioglossoides (strain CBS 100239) TaxID=1163406 RepID=A0A0L0NEN6_TOLOC|nr:hypothetical protein TOPH_02757 [Tolypocladium ophioglossoides CBS 100239]